MVGRGTTVRQTKLKSGNCVILMCFDISLIDFECRPTKENKKNSDLTLIFVFH